MISDTSLKKASVKRYSGGAGFPFAHCDFIFTDYVKSRELTDNMLAVKIKKIKIVYRQLCHCGMDSNRKSALSKQESFSIDFMLASDFQHIFCHSFLLLFKS